MRRSEASLEDLTAAAAGQRRYVGQVQIQTAHGVEAGKFLAQGQTALRDAADAPPQSVGRLETLLQQSTGARVPAIVHGAGIGVDHLGPAVTPLFGHEAEGQQNVRRFKASHNGGDVVFPSKESIRGQTEDGGDMARQQEGFDRLFLLLRIVQQGAQGGGYELVQGKHAEVVQSALLCGQDNDCTASTVGSILGNYYGFSGIPAKWVSMLDTDGILFSNTDCTFDAAVELNYLLAESVMSKNGIDTEKEVYIIPREESVIPSVLEQWPKEAPPAVENNIAPEGTPILSVESPSGNGSRDIGVINDGIIPDVHSSNSFEMFQMQYGTYTGSAADVGYVGYVFENERCFDKIVFQEGMHFADGGWFSDGITVQIRRNGVWEDIAAEVTPVYPVSNDQAEFGSPLEYFLFTFEPVC